MKRAPVGLLVLAALALAPVAKAELPRARPPAASTPEADARQAMREGLTAMDAGDAATALAHFQRATELVPQANVPHLHAGRALEALGRQKEAIEAYETYLRIKPDVSDASEVRMRLAVLRAANAPGTLVVPCEAPSIVVLLDGVQTTLPPSRALEVEKGPHRVELRLADGASRTHEIEVEPGKVMTVACPASKAQMALTASPPPARKEEPLKARTPWYGRWWVLAGAGVVLAAGAGGAYIASTRESYPSSEGGVLRFGP